MGDINIDQWVWKMREHKRKGHTNFSKQEIDNKIRESNQEKILQMKKRIDLWECNHNEADILA